MKLTQSQLALLCCLGSCVILTLGLWPFHSPANDVTWLNASKPTAGNGLLFQGTGTVFSTSDFSSPASPSGYSAEIWAEPVSLDNGESLLTFQNQTASNCPQVSIQRAWSDLKIETRLKKNYFQVAKREIYADNVFHARQPVFVSITSGAAGTRLYADGVLIHTASGLPIFDCAFHGKMIVGDSAGQSNGWSGPIRGVAVYRQELEPARVREHFETWTTTGKPLLDAQDQNVLLYLFDEHTGRVAHDQGPTGLDLEIPARYQVLGKAVLPSFWDEFASTPGYWQDVFNNIVGFVPVGLCFAAYFAAAGRVRRPALAAMLAGMALSFTIEGVQPFLATRESGTTDLLTNALGTGLGVRLFAGLRKSGWLNVAGGAVHGGTP
jgi:hypothetical protein